MSTIARPLDFIILGVPRSGTKGLVHALNLHPHVYCAEERFHYTVDHAQIRFPDSFVDTRRLWNEHDLSKTARIKAELAQKRDIREAGNKLPRYYLALERINKEVPALKNIWIYRSPYGFMPSWNRRESESHLGQWPAGQVGLFGVLDLLVCIEKCLNLPKDVFVFPYANGLGRCADVTLQALGFLGVDTTLYNRQIFERKQLRKEKSVNGCKGKGSGALALMEHEEELLSALRIKELDTVVEQGCGTLLSNIADPLRNYVASIKETLPGAIDRAFLACRNSHVLCFGRQYFQRNRTELDGLLSLARGSKAIGSLTRFGAYDRLKSLHLQRRVLKRKLLALRLVGGV